MTKQPSVSDDIASYCTKCKLNLEHIIIAMVGGKIVKVKCKTCGSSHNLRSGDSAGVKTKARGTESARRRPDRVQTVEAHWEECIAGKEGREMPYRMDSAYDIGDIVLHSVFGIGIVQKEYPKKCTMLFKDKERALVSANTE